MKKNIFFRVTLPKIIVVLSLLYAFQFLLTAFLVGAILGVLRWLSRKMRSDTCNISKATGYTIGFVHLLIIAFIGFVMGIDINLGEGEKLFFGLTAIFVSFLAKNRMDMLISNKISIKKLAAHIMYGHPLRENHLNLLSM